MLPEERRRIISERFTNLYTGSPKVWSQAPGRVDLMGSHTDYNQGYVLTQAIDRNTWIAASPRSWSASRKGRAPVRQTAR